MTTIPAVVPPFERENRFARRLPRNAAFGWLAAGWSDLKTEPLPSLLYGLVIFLVSVAIVVGLFVLGWDYILFPALAGFMVVGPILATGLYEKSRRLARGEPVGLRNMILVEAKSVHIPFL